MSGATSATNVMAASAGLQAGSSVGGALGSYYSSKGEKLSLEAQARSNKINAELAELKAQAALRQGQNDEQNVRLNTAALKSKQTSSFAGRGIDVYGSDTSLNILTETDLYGEIDANTVAANAANAAWGYRTEGVGYQNASRYSSSAAGNVSPYLNSATSLLTSATQLSSNYSLYKRSTGGSF